MATRAFKDFDEREVLALAISLEEEDGRIYGDFVEGLRETFPATAEVFDRMRREEGEHRRRLIDEFQRRFGDHIPLVRRQEVKGCVERTAVWLARPLALDAVRRQAEIMELETRQFYDQAAARTGDADTRRLLGDLTETEREHSDLVEQLEREKLPAEVRKAEDADQRRLFVLQVVQPGLAGLMDGSVSTLAPVLAAAFVSHNSWTAFLVGMAASIGAGISMGFAEALSDDGVLSGRGHPWTRGLVCGAMTTAGGIGHALPFLITSFFYAMCVAVTVVVLG